MNNLVLTEAVYYTLLSLIEPLHGYGIMQNTLKISNGRVNLAPGTLYGALNTLLKKGWIITVNDNMISRKKEYIITDEGRKVLNNELQRLKELVGNGEKILGEG